MTQQENKDESVNQREGSISQNTKVELSEKTLSVLAIIFSVAAFMMGIWAITESQRSARETRVLQQLSMDHDALLIREGLKQPGDESKGPAANLDYKPRSK
jgi:hypothetical protein